MMGKSHPISSTNNLNLSRKRWGEGSYTEEGTLCRSKSCLSAHSYLSFEKWPSGALTLSLLGPNTIMLETIVMKFTNIIIRMYIVILARNPSNITVLSPRVFNNGSCYRVLLYR